MYVAISYTYIYNLQPHHFQEHDESNNCITAYGQCVLSPVNLDGVMFALNYTLDLVSRYPSVTSFMMDNALWQSAKMPPHLPSGFSTSAQIAFKAYIRQRLGNCTKQYLGIPEDLVKAPLLTNRSVSNPSPLFGLWKVWRSRAYAKAVSMFRSTLHIYNISLVANTVFWPNSWQNGCSDLLQHVDAFLSESHFNEASIF